MGITRENNTSNTVNELRAEIAPHITAIESMCGVVIQELLGSNRQGLILTTGTRLDMLRSLEAVKAACRSVETALQTYVRHTAPFGGEEVRQYGQ